MQAFSLTWEFLQSHSPEPYLVPAPWHLLLVLTLLGALAAVGLHHLVGYTYRLYQVRGRPSPWLAFPTLAVLLVSTECSLVAYLLGAQAEGVVQVSLASLALDATEESIGRALLAPVFGASPGEGGGEQDGSVLRAALLGLAPKALRASFTPRLENLAQHFATSANRRPRERGLAPAPPHPEDSLPAAPSPLLELLALQWAANPEQVWPHAVRQGEPAEALAVEEGAGESLPAQPGAEPALPFSGGEPAATTDGGAPPAATGGAGPPGEGTPGTSAASEPAGGEPPAPPRTPATDHDPEGGKTFPLPRLVANLVMEVPPGAPLERADWEAIAGSRFVDWVLQPYMVWQVRYLALLMLVLVGVFDVLYFLVLLQVRRFVPTPAPNWRDRAS